ncbi:MAG: hypothetical protein ACKO96_08855, partial [Flammeovirgaceae bacterium]
MKKTILSILMLTSLILAASRESIAQVKISAMPETKEDPAGGWIPVVLGNKNYKYNPGSYVQQKTIDNIRGLSPTNLPANYVYYVTDLGKQGIFQYDNADATSVDDGAIVLVTKNNLRFKRIIENNTVNAKWFEMGDPAAAINTLIYLNNTAINYAQAQAIFNTAASRVTLSNTDFTTQTATWFALQRAINFCLQSGNKLYIPAGRYNLTKGLLIASPPVSSFVDGFEIQGATTAYSSHAASHTIISLENYDNFAIGIQRGKGIRIRNLYVIGKNAITGNEYDYFEKPSMNWVNGCRTNTVSPYAGFIVDPFFVVKPGDLPNEHYYPGFEPMYVDSVGSGGSTDIIFENCKAEQFIVGYALSPHFAPQNGDAIAINNSLVSYCKSGISVGQSQNKSIYVNNLKCWGGVEALFDSNDYSDGGAQHVEVDGLQIAGGVKYLCKLSKGANKGLIIRRMFAESLYSLGGFFNDPNLGALGNLIIEDSFMKIQGAAVFISPSVHNVTTIFKGGLLKMVNSYFMRYNNEVNPPFIINANAIFENCEFDAVPFSLNQTISFKNCRGAGGNYFFGDGETIAKGKYPAENYNSNILFDNDMKWATSHAVSVPSNEYSYQRKAVGTNNFYRKVIISSLPKKLTSVDHTQLTGTFSLSPTSAEYKMIKISDPIVSVTYNTPVPIQDEFNDVHDFILGVVKSKDDATGTITLSKIAKNVTTDTELYQLYAAKTNFLLSPYILGNITTGSNIVSGCVIERDAPLLIPVGVTITSPYFPSGTHIVSISANSITLSNQATATVQGVEIIGAPWYGEERGVIDIWNYKNGYREGDVIYNIDPINYPA